MAYTDPHVFRFQDEIDSNTDSHLNALQANLDDLLARYNGINMASSCVNMDNVQSKMMFVHFGKWLYYLNKSGETAVIKPYDSNLGDDVSLPDATSIGGGAVDLTNAVEWLFPGQPYWLENALFGIEMENL